MPDLIETITPENIGQVLRKAKVLPAQRDLYLELVPGNLERRDSLERANLRVYSKNRPLYFLTVGRNLSGLWKTTQAFAAACPTITCQPAFRHQTGDLEYIGLEYFDGIDVESAVLNGQCTPATALAAANTVLTALERTFRSSRIESAAHELDRLFARVLASPMFSGLDQRFLKDVILPFVRAGALRGPSRSRWSNGDFVPRNVLVNRQGEVRLIDYEFAHRTHFSADDWWRWRTFNSLPPEARELPNPSRQEVDTGCMEALFILRQMVLSHETNGAQLAVNDARHWTDRLLGLAAQAHGRFRSSLFLQPLGAAPVLAPPSASAAAPALLSESLPHRKFTAQLYWQGAHDAGYDEARSQLLECPAGQPALLRFNLHNMPAGALLVRIDPVDAVGLVSISHLRFTKPGSPEVLLDLPGMTGWHHLTPGGGFVRLADENTLSLLSLNDDPQLYLPPVQLGTAGDLVCEIALLYTPHLNNLPELLHQPARAALDEMRGQLEQATTQADDRAARLAEAEKDRRAETQARIEAETQFAAAREQLQQATTLADQRAAEINTLGDRLALTEAARAEASQQIQALSTQADDRAARLAEAEKDRRAETQARIEAETQLAAAREQLQQATTLADQRAAEINTLGDRLALTEAARAEASQQIQALSTQADDRAARLAEAEKDRRAETQARIEAETQFAAAREQLQQATTLADQRAAEINTLGDRLALTEAARAEASQQIQALSTQADDRAARLAEAEKDRRAETQARIEAETQLAAAREQLQQATTLADQRAAEINTLGDRLALTEAARAEASQQIQALSTQADDRAARLAEAEKDRRAETQARIEAETQFAAAREQLQQATTQLQQANAQSETRLAEVSALTHRLREMEQQLKLAHGQIQQANADLEAHHTEARHSETELRGLLARLEETAAQASAGFATSTAQRDWEIMRLNLELEQARVSGEEMGIRLQSLQEEIIRTANQLAASQQDNSALTEMLKQTRDELADTREAHARLAASLSATQAEHTESIRQLELLQQQLRKAQAVYFNYRALWARLGISSAKADSRPRPGKVI